jgi:hypothetical protein
MGPRAGLDTVAKVDNLYPCRQTNPGRPVLTLVTTLTELSFLTDLGLDGRMILEWVLQNSRGSSVNSD